MGSDTDAEIRNIYERWHEAILARDLEALIALYSLEAVFETPLVIVTLSHKADGVLRGHQEIRDFFDAGLRKMQGSLGRWYRTGTFFANGRQLIWEYPRETPDGNQVDLVEAMDIVEGLIVHHRVYWGWVGFKSLTAASAPAASA